MVDNIILIYFLKYLKETHIYFFISKRKMGWNDPIFVLRKHFILFLLNLNKLKKITDCFFSSKITDFVMFFFLI